MPDTLTTNYGYTKPEVGGSNDTWGDKLNADLEAIDAKLKTLSDDVAAVAAAGGLTLASFGAINSTIYKKNDGTLGTAAAAVGTVLGRRATGEIGFYDYATLKNDLALNNVENYSRAQLKTYFDTLYSPVGSGGGGTISGQPLDATLTAVATTGINANQLWVGTGPDALALKSISPYMANLLATADQATLQTNIGSLAVTAQSLVANNGYVKLANGFMLQWGSLTVGGNARPVVNYPVAFASFSVAVGSGGRNATDGPNNCRIVASATTNFQCCNNDPAAVQFWWIAVGK